MKDKTEKNTLLRDKLEETLDKLTNGKITGNQARTQLGLKPIEGCDYYMIIDKNKKDYLNSIINANFENSKAVVEVTYSDQIINLKDLDEATIRDMKNSSCELKPFSF